MLKQFPDVKIWHWKPTLWIQCVRLVVLTAGLIIPLGSTVASESDEHPFYQNLLDSLNSSERFHFEKRSYERTGSSAKAQTYVYDLSAEATQNNLFTLDHSIVYPKDGQMVDIATGSSARRLEVTIKTTLDTDSLAPASRAAVSALFGDTMPLEVNSIFKAGSVDHHLTIASAYHEDDDISIRSDGIQAGVFAMDTGTVAAYARLADSAVVTDVATVQIEQMLVALSSVPDPQGTLPLYEFSFSTPGAVNIIAPFGDLPFTITLKDIEVGTDLHYEDSGYGAGLSIEIGEAMIPFVPVQGAHLSTTFHGLTRDGKQGLEQFVAQAYEDGQLSNMEQQNFTELLRTRILSPGLGITVESGFKTIFGKAHTRVEIGFNNQFHEPPSSWQTRGDLLRNLNANITINADRFLYNLIPASQLPAQAVVDRLVVFDSGRVSADMRLENGVAWLNGEPTSLSLILAEEMRKPLWPDLISGEQSELADTEQESKATGNYGQSIAMPDQNSDDLPIEMNRDGPEQNDGTTSALTARQELLELEMRILALEAEKLRLQEESAEAERTRKTQEQQRAQRARVADEKAEQERLAALAMEDNARLARHKQRQLTLLRSRYFNAIRQRVEKKWRKPLGYSGDVDCTVAITQNIGGEVLRVLSVVCADGGDALQTAVESAVLASSPLPRAPDRALFDRRVKFYFRPA